MGTLALIFGIFLLTVIILNSCIFLLAILLEDNSIMDIAYGPVYAAATFGTMLATNALGITAVVVSTLIGLWSARLSIRILRKNFGKPEDIRYRTWRETWKKKGDLYFIVRSYLQVFILQGIVISLVSIPVIIIIANPLTFNLYFLISGTVVWLIGFFIETAADWQLDSFIKRKAVGTESSNLLTAGLFRYSRRPNYFGETLIWWGFCIIALPFTYGYLAIISPLILTYIVTKITGPMLENIFIETYGDEYRAYQKQTSYFFPLPPRKA